jgi:hypothetical protein
MDENTYVEYYQSKMNGDSGKQELIHKNIDNLDISIKTEYSNYPDYNNPDFIYRLSNKLEFFHMKSLLNITDISNKCNLLDVLNKDNFSFELSNNQQFLKNFINKKNPLSWFGLYFHGGWW